MPMTIKLNISRKDKMYVKSKIVKNALIIRKVLILESRKLVLLNAVTYNCVKMLLLSNNSFLKYFGRDL